MMHDYNNNNDEDADAGAMTIVLRTFVTVNLKVGNIVPLFRWNFLVSGTRNNNIRHLQDLKLVLFNKSLHLCIYSS